MGVVVTSANEQVRYTGAAIGTSFTIYGYARADSGTGWVFAAGDDTNFIGCEQYIDEMYLSYTGNYSTAISGYASGTRFFACVTYNGTTGNIYVRPVRSSAALATTSAAFTVTPASGLWLGQGVAFGSHTYGCLGAYNRVLTLEEIQRQSRQQWPISYRNLWAYWDFTRGGQASYNDESGSGRTGTTVNTPANADVWLQKFRGRRKFHPIGAGAPSPTEDLEGFRWRNDDGSESAATWINAQDADLTAPNNVRKRFRGLVNATNDPSAAQYTLEYRRAGSSLWIPVHLS